MVDVHTVTVAYLGQNFKPVSRVIVNQSIGENNGIYSDWQMSWICLQLTLNYNELSQENLAWI